MADEKQTLKPPYTTFKSFSNFINGLRETDIPPQIDATMMGTMSGGAKYSLINALKYLKLIDSNGTPMNLLREFVSASDEHQQKEVLKKIIRTAYPTLWDGSINLGMATQGSFDERLRKDFGITGSTVDKVAAFFIGACDNAGLELSDWIKKRKPIAASSASSRKTRKAKEPDINLSGSGGTNPNTVQMTERALEYRLVDLMTEAAGRPEVLQSIVDVITFLKTKDATPPKIHTKHTEEGIE